MKKERKKVEKSVQPMRPAWTSTLVGSLVYTEQPTTNNTAKQQQRTTSYPATDAAARTCTGE